MEYSIERVTEAYNKLRAYIYYDSGELLLREKIVVFETGLSNAPDNLFKVYKNKDYFKYIKDEDGNFIPNYKGKITLEMKLQVITDRLNNYHREPDFFDKFINEVDVKIFPKVFVTDNFSNKIVSNQRVKEKYSLEKATAFIDTSIEIHILSVLWILNQGVKIDSDLLPECIGNRLLLNKNKDSVIKGSSLFKPYFKQYQKWRDGAVEIAKDLLSQNKNALFLNLDIKDYFYSVRVDIDKFPIGNRRLGVTSRQYNLNKILLKVHKDYTLIITDKFKLPYDFIDEVVDAKGNFNKVILPIGLLSSYVLANDYLKEFDKVIIEKFKPAYYGRYVDDILLVLSEPNPLSFSQKNFFSDFNFSFSDYKKKINENKNKFYDVNFDESKLSQIELYILNNFNKIVSLVDNPFYDKKNNEECICDDTIERIFKVNGYPSLFFQSSKTLLHYFDKDESSIVIDKLKKELKEKSSEFRDMPNEQDDSNNFEESAYYLQYDGTDGKIKTLKDYKEDRFGLSVYLSHKINFALRNQKMISEEEQDKIIKFFRGENCLALYKLWEKILTLLLINNQPKYYMNFLFHCIEQIDKIESNRKYSDIIVSNLKETMINYLFCAHEVSLSLNLNFLNSNIGISREYVFKSNHFKNNIHTMFFSNLDFIKPNSLIAKRYRKANMIRHHYVVIPLLNYTIQSKKSHINLVDKKLHIESYKIDKKLLKNSPRPIRFWECCIASSFQQFYKFSQIKNLCANNEGYIETEILFDIEKIEEEFVFNDETLENELGYTKIKQNYLDIAFEFYIEGNQNHSNDYDDYEELKKKFYNFFDNKFEVDKENTIRKPKISFANTEILEENILKSILRSPNLTSERYNKLALILKKAREENTDILLFPECFVPFNLLSTLARYSSDNQSLLVSGLEHLTINKTSFNFVVSIIPVEVNGIKDAIVVLRLKKNYSPGEEFLINKNHLLVPKSKQEIQITNWRNIYFSVCYCFEMANITHREQLKSKIDLLIAIEWNKDVPYFSNIVESSSRDLHCYVAQVNTSNFGDTRLTQPKETAIKDILRLKGGINDVILVGEIDIKKLRDFQRIKSSINESKEFKPLPPDFLLEQVMKRINNR
ncbi:reverse transcriptase domain-containing protein [Flavobacterium aestivum]|uniref:reverse transcriptase domain-containing protein n=1 Tax=Flavobacterium aestivum TaxID=3003257 RepID=UPI002482DC71|nr:reverse transcriptase domain-containing protein [Flavobacterium aestivum]